jgi:hypothetical protein
MDVSVVLDFGICSLVGVAQIARLVIVAVHQLQQAIHEVIDVLKAPRRLTVPVDCNILACQCIAHPAFSVYSLLSVCSAQRFQKVSLSASICALMIQRCDVIALWEARSLSGFLLTLDGLDDEI